MGEILEDFREKYGFKFVNLVNDRVDWYENFVVDFTTKIEKSWADICVDEQPSSFFKDPIHYVICSYTVELGIHELKMKILTPSM